MSNNNLDRDYGRFSAIGSSIMKQSVDRLLAQADDKNIREAKRKARKDKLEIIGKYNQLVDDYNALTDEFNQLKANNAIYKSKISELSTSISQMKNSAIEAEKIHTSDVNNHKQKIYKLQLLLEEAALNAQAYKMHLESVNANLREQVKHKNGFMNRINKLYARNTFDISRHNLINQANEVLIKILHVQNTFLTSIVNRLLDGEDLSSSDIEKMFSLEVKNVDDRDASRGSSGYTEAVLHAINYPTKLSSLVKFKPEIKQTNH